MEIAVAVLLALAGFVLVALVAALATRRGPVPAGPAIAADVDDLPDFLESPPGSAAPARPATDGVVALAPAPHPAAPPPPPPSRPVPPAAPAALAGLLVLLLVAAAVVATVSAGPDARRDDDRRGAAQRPERSGGDAATTDEARLRFGGIVLEERAVGVTVSYPELVLEVRSEGPVASLELPTWNCLASDAPEDPVEAGCAPGRTEHAQLPFPHLQVTRDLDALRIAGAFPTTTRPAGSDPEFTGRTYDLVVTVRPEEAATADRWVPAAGRLELGDRRTTLVEGHLRVPD